jgi:hypothetical protein
MLTRRKTPVKYHARMQQLSGEGDTMYLRAAPLTWELSSEARLISSSESPCEAGWPRSRFIASPRTVVQRMHPSIHLSHLSHPHCICAAMSTSFVSRYAMLPSMRRHSRRSSDRPRKLEPGYFVS